MAHQLDYLKVRISVFEGSLNTEKGLALPDGTPSMTSMRWMVAIPTWLFGDRSAALHLSKARATFICPPVINLDYLHDDLSQIIKDD